MDEDQNSDLSCGQSDHNVGISQSIVEVEQDLEQLQVNCHKEIRHSEIEWAWSSAEYERTTPCHIQGRFVLVMDKLFPRSDDGLGR